MMWAWWQRLIHGPTDAEISARSQAAGGPPYPIPRLDPRPLTHLQATGRFIQATEPGMPWQQVVEESEKALHHPERNRQRERTTVNNPGPTGNPRPGNLGDALRAENADTSTDLPRSYPAPDGTLNDLTPLRRGDPTPNLPARPADPFDPDLLTDSGVHHLPTPDRAALRTTCPHCGGTGYQERTVNELLRESIALIPPDGGDHVIREFYRRLLTAAPDLAALFPPDLITAAVSETGSPGRLQRDKLLQALAALADLYGTTPTDRQRLDSALRIYGRSHAAFARPDGTTRGATVEEYLAVKKTLLDTLHAAAGSSWVSAYDAAWHEAYDYAMVIMLHEQMTGGLTFPRQPRAAAPTASS